MDIRINLPQGSRIDSQCLNGLLGQALKGSISLPPDPGEGHQIISWLLDDQLYAQIYSRLGIEGSLAFLRQVILASVLQSQKTQLGQRFELSQGIKDSFGIFAALAIPIVILVLLIWLLGRSTQDGSGFAAWPGGNTAA